MKTIDAYFPVSDMHFICPRVVEAFSDFECTLKVTTGSNMYLRVITPLGDIINGTMEGNLSVAVHLFLLVPTYLPTRPPSLPPFPPSLSSHSMDMHNLQKLVCLRWP